MLQGFYSKLTATPALIAIVGSSIYPLVLPGAVSTPAITYNLISTHPVFIDIGGARTTAWESSVSVSCWATSYLQATSGIAAVASAFDCFHGGLSDGTTVLFSGVESLPDEFEPDTRYFRCLVLVKVIYF